MRIFPILLLAACSSEPEPVPPTVPALALVAHMATPDKAAVPMVLTIKGKGIHSIKPYDGSTPVLADRVLRADRVTAGFVDAHAHPMGLGRQLAQIDLTDAASFIETQAWIREGVGQRDGAQRLDGWLLGRGWDQNDWDDTPPGRWPTATELDQLTGDTPAAFRRIDGHATWANSAALRASGINANTPDPPGGRILRDNKGRPSGVLIDTASDLLHVPEPSYESKKTWLLAGLRAAAEAGLTAVHDMGVDDDLHTAYLELADELPIRVVAYAATGSKASELLLKSGPQERGRFRLVGVKAYADGALGSRGAQLLAPYTDEPEHTGLVLTSPDDLKQLAADLVAVDAQLAVHAIGDAAVRATLDAFEHARTTHPDKKWVPLRVEHAQVVHPDDMARFNKLRVWASMQPTHATSDMPWAQARLGAERIDRAYAWRAALDAQVELAFGSDFPVERADPGLGLWAATTRMDLEGHPEGGWLPDQRLSMNEAILAFTEGPNILAGTEKRLGHLDTRMDADLTAWSVEQLHGHERWTAVATVVGGEVVWTSLD